MPVLLLALIVVAAGLTAATVPDALAQQGERPWTLRDLFSPRKADRLEPVVEEPVRRTKARKKSTKKEAPARVAKQKEPEAAAEKEANAQTVMVVGDFLAGGLAEGLTAAYAGDPGVEIVDRTNGSSGFVRDDFYNWPAEIGALIEEEEPDAIIVMLGGNDRQEMHVGGGVEKPRSEVWSREYSARTEALAKEIAERKVPFVWVGVPAFKFSSMLSDMLAFNDFYRTAAEGVGAEFVDVWDGFVDENGAYVATGPDINGQPVKLRAEDGINFTKAGKRKLAFFAEKPLSRILEGSETEGVAGFAPANAPGAAVPEAVDIGSIKRTEPISLRDPALDGGAELLGQVVAPKSEPRSPGERLTIEGIAPDALPGRADDFSWPPMPAPPAATPAGGYDTTSSIRP